ncbi:Protein of unknown function [Gryllus bimaculatus]|nr:Protein of unknown function [Gryllus bimaculatus]
MPVCWCRAAGAKVRVGDRWRACAGAGALISARWRALAAAAEADAEAQAVARRLSTASRVAGPGWAGLGSRRPEVQSSLALSGRAAPAKGPARQEEEAPPGPRRPPAPSPSPPQPRDPTLRARGVRVEGEPSEGVGRGDARAPPPAAPRRGGARARGGQVPGCELAARGSGGGGRAVAHHPRPAAPTRLRESLLSVLGSWWCGERRGHGRRRGGGGTGPEGAATARTGSPVAPSLECARGLCALETERRIRANDREYNSQFNYAPMQRDGRS